MAALVDEAMVERVARALYDKYPDRDSRWGLARACRAEARRLLGMDGDK